MQSRLLDSLLAEAKTTPDRVTWARAACRAAAHMARSGQPDHALNSIGLVREQFGPGLHPEVASWLMLAEGILHFCRFANDQAYDRIQRAYGLAVAFKVTDAIPSCAAWLSLLEFNTLSIEKMTRHLQEAFTLAKPSDHQALTRACMVAACAFHIASNFETARPWYEKARLHATSEGDEVSLGAIFFNVATFRMVEVRLEDAFSGSHSPETKRAFMEAAGSFSFDQLTKNEAQEPLRLLLRAQHLTVERRFAEAKELLDALDGDKAGNNKMPPIVLADRIWCAANVGALDEAKLLLASANDRFSKATDSDDQAFIFARASQAWQILGNTAESKQCLVAAEAALERYRSFQSKIFDSISVLPAP
jgi:hypothetical protein